jgi:drug/metabolite transporter (DMT)-like permease
MSTARPREDRLLLGVSVMGAAVFFFTSIDTSAKWLILAGLPPLQVVFCRYAGHFLLSLAIFLPSEGREVFHSHRPGLQFLRSSFLMGGTIFNFLALNYLPISVTTTIFFAGPMVVTLLSVPILGEKVGTRRLAAVVTGFAGVLVVVQPWGAQFHPAMFLSLGALIFASLYFVMTRLLAGVETNAASQTWSSGPAALLLLPFVVQNWQWPDTLAGYVVLVLIGTFGVSGHMAVVTAHRFADASLLAPVVYLQLIFATLAGILIFSTYPTLWTLAGAVVIIGSGIYIWRREQHVRD